MAGKHTAAEVVGMNSYYDGPVWIAYGLTYAAYFVAPRKSLQSMPYEWQEKFVSLMNEAHEYLEAGAFPDGYSVKLRGENGRYRKDPLADYRHGGPVARATQPLPPPNEEA